MKRTLLRNEGRVKGVHTLDQGTLRWHHDRPRAEETWEEMMLLWSRRAELLCCAAGAAGLKLRP